MKFQPNTYSKQIVFSLVVMLTTLQIAYSQSRTRDISQEKLAWNSDQATEQRSSSAMSYSCSFKTDGRQSVVWIQKNGQRTTTFTVRGTEGSWTDVSQPGSFTWLLTYDGRIGKMTAVKNESDTYIILDFSESGEHAVHQKFRVHSVQPYN